MSRRAPRIRAQLTVTVRPEHGADLFVCRTRDISDVGCFLETAMPMEPGTRMQVSVFDDVQSRVIEVDGEVTRRLPPTAGGFPGGVGLIFDGPMDEWRQLVAVKARQTDGGPRPDLRNRRLRVLVVGDEARQRGALALYVTSGWDIRFASNLTTAIEALHGVKLSAVIAEHDVEDRRWEPILAAAREAQPAARRIVRGALGSGPAQAAASGGGLLVHRFVDRDAGLEALLDALTADIGIS